MNPYYFGALKGVAIAASVALGIQLVVGLFMYGCVSSNSTLESDRKAHTVGAALCCFALAAFTVMLIGLSVGLSNAKTN